MRGAELTARLESINERKDEIEEHRSLNRAFGGHVNSRYFRDAVASKHPFLWPSEDRDEYLERQRYFAAPIREKVARWRAEAEKLPHVASQKWDQRRSARIGIIADRSLFASLSDAATLSPITPSNYEQQIQKIDVLLVSSTWRGLEGEWAGLADIGSPLRDLLVKKIVRLARDRDVPVVFYSTEDPAGFSLFRRLAVHADYVFTAALKSVPEYQKLLRPDVPVDVLPFGVNFAHHHPLGSMRHEGREFVFAGSWLRDENPERRFAAERIFDGLIEAGADVTIIDALLESDGNSLSRPTSSLFPDRYLPYLHGPIPHEALVRIQRLLPVGINLNSEIASQTTFARSALELQATGTLILSNYNAGVNSLFPHIVMPDNGVDVEQILDQLTQQSVRESQVAGIRAAFSTNTAFDRVDQILDAVGHASERPSHRVLVSGLSEPAFSDFIGGQTYSSGVEFVSTDQEDRTRGSRDGDVHLHLEQDRGYGPNLIRDLVSAFRYSDADAVAAHSRDFAGPLFELSDATDSSPTAVWVHENQTLKQSRVDARQTVSIVSDQADGARPSISVHGKPELSVIVPIYNNGPHLKAKCFASLRRSSVFARSEILLIDDGSTDPETISIINELDAHYPNVRLYRFPPGGSGSASRPRNKGLELVRTPYVTNLDPDDEQTNDGYARLLDIAQQDDYDFAVGNAVIQNRRRGEIDHAKMLRGLVHEDGTIVENALSKLNYAPVRIQTILARTDWLRDLGLTQVVGSQGQDTFFFQQLFHSARKIGILPENVHTYYAAVENSVVNTVGIGFYRKYIDLERTRAEWLDEVGLLEDYNERRLEPFFRNWFLGKLPRVKEEDRPACRRIIRQLGSFYGRTEWKDARLREFFSAEATAQDEV